MIGSGSVSDPGFVKHGAVAELVENAKNAPVLFLNTR